MRLALVGPPQAGKTTLYFAITGQKPDPGRAAAEHIASLTVPDDRLNYLFEVYKPKKRAPAHLELVDQPGHSLAEAHGQAAFRKSMDTVRRCDGIVMVVRAFGSDSVAKYRGRIDPKADLEELHTELIFTDLEQVANRIQKLEKSVQKPSKTRDEEARELTFMHRIQKALEAEKPVAGEIHNDEERSIASSFGFLTLKPVVVVINVGESEAGRPPPFQAQHAQETIALSAEIEAEILQLPDEDRAAFLADLGLAEPASLRLIHACYKGLGLISFLTIGGDEVRAWTIKKGTPAIEAAGKVHTDMQRGFIKAEVVSFVDLRAHKDFKGAKNAGKARLEPKHYVVQDGDVIDFRFNV